MVGQGYHNAIVDSTDSELSDNDNLMQQMVWITSVIQIVVLVSYKHERIADIDICMYSTSTKQCFHFLSHSSCDTQLHPPTLYFSFLLLLHVCVFFSLRVHMHTVLNI